MAVRLKLDHLEAVRKAVHRSASWQCAIDLDAYPEIARKLVHIIRCIENGTVLPSGYYRKGVGLDSDFLLDRHGIMHLHLGRSNTSELLYLVQYADHVVLLELSDHAHFATKPVGARLASRHDRAVARFEADLNNRPIHRPPAIKLRRPAPPSPGMPPDPDET